jgi:ABC-type multidrug transport system fused ATPase/permease subunit
MTNKLLLIIKRLINSLSYIMIGLWGLLTIIVIIFLIQRWANPGWKSISNHDLMDYGQITLIVLPIVGFLFFVSHFINKRLASK